MTPRVVNLCFHGIGTPQRPLEAGEAPYWVTVDLFEEVLDLAAEDPTIRLSFDDGNASDAEIALPALTERRLTATVFPLAGRLDTPGSLGRDALRAMRSSGIAIGSHGMNHVPWDRLASRQIDDELVRARELIAEAIDAPIDEAALPLGRYGRRTLGLLRHAGYVRVYSSDRRHADPGSWFQPRYSIRGSDSIDDVRRLVDFSRTRQLSNAARSWFKRTLR